jgi:hypothetical protein
VERTGLERPEQECTRDAPLCAVMAASAGPMPGGSSNNEGFHVRPQYVSLDPIVLNA